MMDKIDQLRREIAKCEEELAELRSQLAVAESEQREHDNHDWQWPLAEYEYERYSRQMIVPNFGLQGQLRLKKAKVLIIGAGGLGCPASAYLAGAGVGTLGLVDGDVVEVSNLHRQVAHSTNRVGRSKVESAITYLEELNPSINYRAHIAHLTPQNAEEIVGGYDVVLDCTDHPTSRYLISDICVLLSKPLVSASAFQTSGQLIVLNNPPRKGPCYRCVFPKPPPPESVVGCGEGGIIGPVVGVMGVLQALETIKLITRGDLEGSGELRTPMMLLFSGIGDAPFRSVRMKGKRDGCFACAEKGGLGLEELKTSMDYVQFCGVSQPVNLLQPEERITAEEYNALSKSEHLLVDVRAKEHFDLCHVQGSVNIPISQFTSHRGNEKPEWLPTDLAPSAPVYVVCRVGNDSQIAIKKLRDLGFDRDGERSMRDIQGGLKAWKDTIDPTLPFI